MSRPVSSSQWAGEPLTGEDTAPLGRSPVNAGTRRHRALNLKDGIAKGEDSSTGGIWGRRERRERSGQTPQLWLARADAPPPRKALFSRHTRAGAGGLLGFSQVALSALSGISCEGGKEVQLPGRKELSLLLAKFWGTSDSTWNERGDGKARNPEGFLGVTPPSPPAAETQSQRTP